MLYVIKGFRATGIEYCTITPNGPYDWFTQIISNLTEHFKYNSKGYLRVKYLCRSIFESHGFVKEMEVT